MKSSRLWFIVSLVVAAAFARLIPHPFNFTPIGAAALFAGAAVRPKWLGFVVPLTAMLLSDAVIGFHSAMPVVYGCFVAIVCIGMLLRRTPAVIAIGAVSSATLFFLVTNFQVWLASGLYAHTLAGFAACYVAAIPFYGNQLAGDLFYAAVLFGGLAIAERRLPGLAEV